MPRQIMGSNISCISNNKCRACMKEGDKMLPMYDDKGTSKINLPYKLAELTSIQVNRLCLVKTFVFVLQCRAVSQCRVNYANNKKVRT